MKTLIGALAVSAALLCGVDAAHAQTPPGQTARHWWNDDSPPPKPLHSPNARTLPRISVRGNHFVDPQGTAVLFKASRAMRFEDVIKALGIEALTA